MIERLYIEVNGMEQGMFIESTYVGKPVLLYLHGGPGTPEIPFTQDHPTGMEELFTLCWWEQRGSGISYHEDISLDTMTIEQMIDDALVVSEYLRDRFSQEKIYVMGHSWGSLLGALMVQRAPELFHAYVGIGQVVRQAESERLAYVYMVEQFREAGNKKMVRRLEGHPIDRGVPIGMEYLSVRSMGVTKLGIGMMHHWRSMMSPVMALLRYKGYSFKDKIKYAKGGAFSLPAFWSEVVQSDLLNQVPRLEVPVYFFHGIFDYQVSYKLAQEYYQALDAPLKGFYTFENSAHSPCFEEPEKMCRILREDVLRGRIDLAD